MHTSEILMELRTPLEVFRCGGGMSLVVLTSFDGSSCINIFLKLAAHPTELRARKNKLIAFGEGDDCFEWKICARAFLTS